MKWCVSTALLFKILSLSVLTWGATATQSASVPDAQTVYANTLNSYVGNRQAVQDNLVKPMTAGGKLTSPDGKTSFTANALQSSDSPLMRVTAAPYPQTGDVQMIIVEQDLTGQGTYNYAATFPPAGETGKMISSVCADGYIQCDPGTFSNCQYRTWSAQPDGSITSNVAGASGTTDAAGNVGALSSCYCFNKYCSKNNSAVLAIDNIAANIGGGVLTALLNAKTGMAVSKAASTGSGVIVYYGANTGSVPNGSSLPNATASQIAAMPVMSADNVVSAQKYYDSPGNLGSLTATASTQQQNSPTSLFALVQNASVKNTGSTVSCSNIVTPQLNVFQRTISKTGGNGSQTTCVDTSSGVILAQTGPTSFAIGTVGETGPYSNVGKNCGGAPAVNPSLNYPAHLVDTIDFTPPSTTYGYKITGVTGTMNFTGGGCSPGSGTANWTSTIAQGTPVVASATNNCGGYSAQYPSYNWQFNVAYDSQEVNEISNLGCRQFETDSNCSVQQETWDGRPVVVNGMPTGFSISGSQLGQVCQDLAGPVRNVHYCAPPIRPWFRQDKQFYCKNTGSSYDFSQIKTRLKGVQNSASMPTDTSMTYTDNGTTYTYGVPTKQPLGACSQVCKTKIPTAATPVTPTAPRTDVETTPAVASQAFSYFFKDCIASTDGSNWTCPTDTSQGEVVVSQCGCGSDMGDAVGALDAVDNATADSICSKN